MIKFLKICVVCALAFLFYWLGEYNGYTRCKELYEFEIHHFNSRKAIALMRRYTKEEK